VSGLGRGAVASDVAASPGMGSERVGSSTVGDSSCSGVCVSRNGLLEPIGGAEGTSSVVWSMLNVAKGAGGDDILGVA
jgi:hypothetical protein